MAEVSVRSWDELVDACKNNSGTSTEPFIINIMNDIDLAEEYPKGFDDDVSVKQYVHIDGKGHTIRNFYRTIAQTDYVKNSAFTLAVGFELKDVDFINIITASPIFRSTTSFNIENCRFVGTRTGNLFDLENSGLFSFNSCYFDVELLQYDNSLLVPLCPSTGGASMTTNNCWFRERYSNGTVYESMNSSFYYAKMNGCYVDGVKCLWSATEKQVNFKACYYDYTPAIQNVFDLDFRVTNSRKDFTKVNLDTPAGIVRNQFRALNDDETPYNPTITRAKNTTILATPDEMKDPAVLSGKGFNIVVP